MTLVRAKGENYRNGLEMFHCLWNWWRKKSVCEPIRVATPDPVDTLNNNYAELLETVFQSEVPVVYNEEMHTRIQRLRSSISEELRRRSMNEDTEKRRSWRFQSIDSEFRLQLFQRYIDDAVKVEPKLLQNPSVVGLLSLDIIG